LTTTEDIHFDTGSFEDTSANEERPYTENDVPPHRQRYGKDKHWKDKAGYHRGGRNSDS
jgi:hypothetical protein